MNLPLPIFALSMLAQHRGPDIDVGQLIYLVAALIATVIGALMQRKQKRPPPRPADQPAEMPRPPAGAGLPSNAPPPPRPRLPSIEDTRSEDLPREQIERLRRRAAVRSVAAAPPPTAARVPAPAARPVAAVAAPATADGGPLVRLRGALRTPADLRTAVILTEVLGPPLALRE